MDKDGKERIEEIAGATLGALSLLAIIGILVKRNFEVTEVYAAVVNFTQVAIPVLVLVVAARLNKGPVNYLKIGRDALVQVAMQTKFSTLLMGPRFNKVDSNPETGEGKEYLFVTNEDSSSTRRAKFIPIQPLEMGKLTVYVQPSTLVYALGYPRGKTSAKDLLNVQQSVCTAVKRLLESRYAGQYVLLLAQDGVESESDAARDEEDAASGDAPVKDSTGSRESAALRAQTAIMVDFNEERMGPRRFRRAVSECVGAAAAALLACRRTRA